MNLRSSLKTAIILLLLLAVGAYVTAEEDLVLGVIAMPLLIAGLWWTRPAAPEGPAAGVLPRWAIPGLIVAASLYAGLSAASSGVDVTLIAGFAIALLLIKLGDRRTARDESQLIALGAFLAVAAVLTNPGFLVGVQVMLFFPTLIAAVMLYQLYRADTETRAHALASVDATGNGDERQQTISGFDRPFRRVAAAATLGSIVAAIGVFIIMPRGIGEGVLGAWGGPRTGSVTGFAETVQLGRAGVISESPEVVLDLVVTDRFKASLGSPDRTFYLRGAVLNSYENGRWTQTHQPGSVDEITLTSRQLQHVITALDDNRAAINQRITIRALPAQSSYLFSLWRPITTEFDRPGRLTVFQESSAFKARPESPGVFSYTVASRPVDPLPDDISDFPRPLVRNVDLPRVKAEAQRILREAGLEPDPAIRPWTDDENAATALATFFEQGFTYSLEQQPPPVGADPIEEFLFTSRVGHCEYFASAMAAMAQSVGVNARVITGYVANEYNESSGSYTVRQDDAHAWVEVQIGPGRWRTFDPTPPADLLRIQQASRDLIGSVRHWLDQIEFAWNRSIVSFDERSRTRLFTEGFGSWGRSMLNWTRGTQAEERARSRRLVPAVMTGIIVFCISAGIGLTVYEIVLRVKRRRRRFEGLSNDPVSRATAGLYERWLDELSRRGVSKPSWRPPLAHAQAIATRDESASEVGTMISNLYYSARFADRSPSADDISHAESALQALKLTRAARLS